MDTELAGDLDGWKATFAPGRISYDLPAVGLLLDEEGARDYLTDMLKCTTDLDIDVIKIHHADEAVILEVRFDLIALSTSEDGEVRRIPMSSRHCVIFRFDGDQMWQETAYGPAVTW
jgi:hypothetical protein